ncbi:gliding motility-associated C-terminal domain-containing protein [Flavobacterium sp. MAHUQ-51]|uniref:gliding motility-associated C-terminal domain-containing protein n=1 Tax=Flavobacterium sp. GCM10022190 TaxID=3252639 RepID=UPI00361EECBF
MKVKILYFVKNNFLKLLLFFLFIFSANSYSQCAGSDATITICDLANPANQSINLYSYLGGTPTPGGVWRDNSKPLSSNTFNGILNAQLIRNSGAYTFTYIQDPSSCSDNEATITVNIGPYAGVPSPNVTVCDDDGSFNLFQAFDGTKLAPQQNGKWTANTNSSSLVGSTIKPNVLREGYYSYTYTIPALGTCPEQSAEIFVSIVRKPVSGAPLNLQICSTVDFNLYKNVNLNDLLSNEDPDGAWLEQSGTTELSSSGDNIIDVQNIYNTLGAGTYSFAYKVESPNPICTFSQSVVEIVIEDPLDFRGSTLTVNSDICEDQIATATYNGVLKRGPQPIPDGTYAVTYSINSGTSTQSVSVNGNFTNGNFNFTLDRSKFPAVGDYTVTINSIIKSTSTGICSNLLGTISDVVSIFATPKINSATLKIDPICSGFDANVEISGNTNLGNGTYRITYSLSGDNTVANQQIDFTAVNGVATFTIPANLIPNAGTNTVFAISNIVNLTSTCSSAVSLSKTFVINQTPDVAAIAVSIENECLEGDTVVQITGLDKVTNATLTYSLSGANSISNQTIELNVESTNASFIIPMENLTNSGTNTFTLHSVKNTTTQCSIETTTNNTASFTLENCNFLIPDGFSPNGDTVNDTFRVPKIEFIYPNFTLEIYNRYGNLMFKGDKNKTEWDGRNSDYKVGIDGMAPNGVYFYILQLNKGNKKPIQGRLYLNR